MLKNRFDLKGEFRGQAFGYTIFILNMTAGNIPALVPYIKSILPYETVLLIMVPGFYGIAVIIWLAHFVKLRLG